MIYATTTTSNCTTTSNWVTTSHWGYTVTAVTKQIDYRDRDWFRDIILLYDEMSFDFHACSHEALPPRRDKEAWAELDTYFLAEMKLEAKGWKSFSIGGNSPRERRRIRDWAKRYPKTVYLSRITTGDDLYAFIGHTTMSSSFCLVVHPSMEGETRNFLERFSNDRPCLIIAKEMTNVIKELLPSNHHVVVGEDATAISFALTPNYSLLLQFDIRSDE